jgi:acetyltransferase-like isoleucine patch superfamily enzyme/SAM-dependent methyltransferase
MNTHVQDTPPQAILPKGVTIGRHSYGYDEKTFRIFMEGARIEIGAFCSIAVEARILAGSEHITTRATTFPLNALLFDPAEGNSLDAIDRGTTTIGNDVWIGLGAVVLSGLAIGDGAVIGAGAVVSKSVPPYAVVAGNPARIVRYRFDDDTRRRLLALRWWEWTDEEITALKQSFMADVDSFLQEAERVHVPRLESDLSRRLREMSPKILTPHRGEIEGCEHFLDMERRIDEPDAMRADDHSHAISTAFAHQISSCDMNEVSMPAEAAVMADPGDDLIARVVGAPDRTWFYWTGRESVRELERTLAIANRSLGSFESILDFGCGCGRMLLWMEELGRTRTIHGTDIDTEAIAWCREHIPYARLSVNDGDPPLPFADGAFDLVFNHSVFTHIDERRQDAWLTELYRVTRPGGFLILTTHGEVALGDDPYGIRERLESEGIVFIDSVLGPDFPLPDWYQNTYHAPWYVFERWGQWFEIRGYVPGGALGVQDHILLERGPDGGRPNLPLAARPQRPATETHGGGAARDLSKVQASRVAGASSRSRFGPAGKLARRLALRMIRPYSIHQDNFNIAATRAVTDLVQTLDDHETRLGALERHYPRHG